MVKTDGLVDGESKLAIDVESQRAKEAELMLSRVMRLGEEDRQVVLEQMPQTYKDLKHRLEVLDSDLDNTMCSSGSSSIFNSNYHQKAMEKIESLESEMATIAMIYEKLTDRNIEEEI